MRNRSRLLLAACAYVSLATVLPAQMPPAPAPPPEETITIEFDPGSARLSNIAKARLDLVALRLKQDPGHRARSTGYSDWSGNQDANQRVSEQRAEACKNYLITRHDIGPARITTEGKGGSNEGRVAIVTVFYSR